MSYPQPDQHEIVESSLVVVAEDQISSDLGGEAVILNMKSGIYHGLNEVGARIWNLLEQPKTVKEVKQVLLEEYEVEAEACTNDLFSLLNNLKAAGLIKVINETAA
ncbi:lasso peptide biosynthesis PqqD family chaperone [Plectonema cf. radiosum LEGE 06105]|uniref:Lasso peptide biosynthesis PqqD family chaperone n=1 Tax=Plectonema cf. radiosum LEGE 06105 TaxID=945769 RepID=A0A8J7K100_9CYAN|nr:lasso peptide biosynthesis PqqD family chaperone [Plectonema radiosum]MBE9213097.1 lasso peptide biosynthesis PqqD family chaperone [Plectonema cf. radiosum LEGE 06105]